MKSEGSQEWMEWMNNEFHEWIGLMREWKDLWRERITEREKTRAGKKWMPEGKIINKEKKFDAGIEQTEYYNSTLYTWT